MKTLERRLVLKTILYLMGVFVCSAIPKTVVGRRRFPPFCSLDSSHTLSRGDIFHTSGDRILDAQLSAEAHHISGVFNVLPGVVFVDDSESPNAFATPETYLPGTQGTILLGQNLTSIELRGQEWGGVAVAGIMAHEFSHIFQFFSPYRKKLTGSQQTSKLQELHADFMAGYYLGLKRLNGPIDIKAFLDSIYLKGDIDFNSKNHHGTPLERKNAMLAGYKLGLYGQIDVNEVAERGAKAVQLL